MSRAGAYNLNEDDVVIARIIKARGIRGEVACHIDTDFPERFETLEQVTVALPNGSRLTLALEEHRFHKDRVLLKFKGTDTMTDAEKLVGGLLVIPESDAWELEEDEFYEYELVGLEVVTESGVVVGRVTRLMRTGASDLLVVEPISRETAGKGDKRELLIPFVDEICTEVDLEANRVTINPPEGLLDL